MQISNMIKAMHVQEDEEESDILTWREHLF